MPPVEKSKQKNELLLICPPSVTRIGGHRTARAPLQNSENPNRPGSDVFSLFSNGFEAGEAVRLDFPLLM
jgi:hypothetical protein